MEDQLGNYRNEERSFVKSQLIFLAVVVVLCTISRNPNALSNSTLMSLGVNISVGDIITIGPLAIFIAMLWRAWEAGYLREARTQLLTGLRRPELPGRGASSALFLLMVLPAVGILVLLWQIITETRAAGSECNAFGPSRLFWDFSLLHSHGFEVKYCFGNNSVRQHSFYIFPPYTNLALRWNGFLGGLAWLPGLVGYLGKLSQDAGSATQTSRPDPTSGGTEGLGMRSRGPRLPPAPGFLTFQYDRLDTSLPQHRPPRPSGDKE